MPAVTCTGSITVRFSESIADNQDMNGEEKPIPIIELAGSPRKMGQIFGESCREAIHQLYTVRMDLAIRFALERGRFFGEMEVLALVRKCLKPTEEFDPDGYEEMRGIGEGSGLLPEQVYAMNGLTDLQDVMAFSDEIDENQKRDLNPGVSADDCSHFVVAGDRAADGKLMIGQNWDLATSNMQFVHLVHRKPDEAPETWSVTTAGCLSLIGINAEGIAVGNTNLHAGDSRIGVQYLTVLHRALSCRSLDEAALQVEAAPRAGAHFYYLAGPDGLAVGLECTASSAARYDVGKGIFVHCNHFLDPGNQKLQVEVPSKSSLHRQSRFEGILNRRQYPISVDDLKECLSDHDGEDMAICRHDGPDGSSTNASVIMCPEDRTIHACRSQPHVGEWVTRTA